MLSALKGIMNQEYQLYVMPKKISMPVRFVFFLLIVEFCKVDCSTVSFMGMQVILFMQDILYCSWLVEKNYSRSYKIEQLKKVMGIRKGHMHAV